MIFPTNKLICIKRGEDKLTIFSQEIFIVWVNLLLRIKIATLDPGPSCVESRVALSAVNKIIAFSGSFTHGWSTDPQNQSDSVNQSPCLPLQTDFFLSALNLPSKVFKFWQHDSARIQLYRLTPSWNLKTAWKFWFWPSCLFRWRSPRASANEVSGAPEQPAESWRILHERLVGFLFCSLWILASCAQDMI